MQIDTLLSLIFKSACLKKILKPKYKTSTICPCTRVFRPTHHFFLPSHHLRYSTPALSLSAPLRLLVLLPLKNSLFDVIVFLMRSPLWYLSKRKKLVRDNWQWYISSLTMTSCIITDHDALSPKLLEIIVSVIVLENLAPSCFVETLIDAC